MKGNYMKYAALIFALVITGCTRVQTGEIGIEKSWDGQVSDRALTNTSTQVQVKE